MAKYPEIDSKDFYKKINEIYQEYRITDSRQTFEEFCFPKQYKLQNSQLLLSKYIHPNTQYKSILIYHRIGSGKTCTAIRIAEEWRNTRKIFIVLPASLKDNFRNELRSMCADDNYLSSKEREELKKLNPSSARYKDIINKSNKLIDEYYNIYSYNKFIAAIQNNEIELTNAILIIDEIQNLISESGVYYKILFDFIMRSPEDLRLVLLSATPMFNKPNEIALTINLLRPKYSLPIGADFDKKFIDIEKNKYIVKNKDLLKKSLKSYVSYYRGAPPYVFPKMKIEYVKCQMSNFQYNVYKEVLGYENKDKKFVSFADYNPLDVNNLPNNFYIGSRFVSNIVFPNKKVKKEGLDSFRGDNITKHLHNYSCKFDKIMNKIIKSTGKVFVYSSFKAEAGIRSFVRVLEEFGYKNYINHNEGKKRFAVWSGDESIALKEQIKNIYNQEKNLDGSRLKILILSPAAKEGISLSGVREAHILEPYWNMARIQQIIGRGSRFCSHKDLPEAKRKINIYVYMATHPDEKRTIDEYLNNLSHIKNDIINEFEKVIKESAIDCELFKNANYYPELDEHEYTCDD